ncbi:MAG TPA: DUF3179 domain-containing protein, partial [Gaiellaceae bacterium]|nr:DUF3179 domain-containing protein [Gaiellaceae bacterium]
MGRTWLLLAVLVAAGCGGAAADDVRGPEAEGAEASDLGGPPPPSLTRGWKTDFSQHSVPFSEIQSGGPPKDGIPPIDAPRFLPVSEVDFLEPREPVIAVEVSGRARAYPIQILMWHEIVNDEIAGVPVSVTFCPLCNTAIVFDRRLDGEVLDFGTTGNLRHSDLVMYDRQTESWWQQFGGEGIVGEHTGKRLERVPARIVAWEEFRDGLPEGEVLSRETGHRRDYGRNPYVGYDDVDRPPFFPVPNADDDRLPPKERVVFLERGEEAVAVPYSVLRERGTVELELAGSTLEVRWREGVASPLSGGGIAEGRDVGAAEV